MVPRPFITTGGLSLEGCGNWGSVNEEKMAQYVHKPFHNLGSKITRVRIIYKTPTQIKKIHPQNTLLDITFDDR